MSTFLGKKEKQQRKQTNIENAGRFLTSRVVFIVSESFLRDPDELKMAKLVRVDFEVFGCVQGVFFRKYTQKKAQELSLKGWCMNTKTQTVVGTIEGEKTKVETMKHWLEHEGSPNPLCLIEKAEFKNEKEISKISFTEFSIKK